MENQETRVQGIGGVFIYAKDPKTLADWYQSRLGLEFQNWGSCFGLELPSRDIVENEASSARRATTTFSIFQAESSVEVKTARLNWRVADMKAMKAKLVALGEVLEAKEEESEYGWFVWLTDPEGNRIELWQPPLNAN